MSEPKPPKKMMSLPAKFVAGFAVGALLGFGLCGISFPRAIGGDRWWNTVAGIGGYSCAFCVLGILVCLVWLQMHDDSPGDE